MIMKVSLPTLKNLLLNNVAEIKFSRRRIKFGASTTRRMMCTNSLQLLNSTEGRLALNYRRAITSPHFDPNTKNLLITWDIFMQDYRCVNMAACELVQVIPANQQFWKFFNEKLALLSPQQKINFMNS
jgi:hypothetical protein